VAWHRTRKVMKNVKENLGQIVILKKWHMPLVEDLTDLFINKLKIPCTCRNHD
jgi:hypothetical protein